MQLLLLLSSYISGLAAAMLPLTAAEPVLSAADQSFLHEQAQRIVNLARVPPGGTSGGRTNTTPYAMLLPDSQQTYTAHWLRDSNMATGADFVSAHDVHDWIKLTAATIRQQDWPVRPGVKVPAYWVPDHINFDGKATYFAGNYEEGEKQGGGLFGALPPMDDSFYFLFDVAEYWRLSGKLDFFQSSVDTIGGPMKLSDLCRKVFDAIPVDAASGIPDAGTGPGVNVRDFGFCDGEQKTGKFMFTAVLRFDAAQRMEKLERGAGDAASADYYRDAAALIKKNLGPVFYHDSGPAGEGWLWSATGDCDQPDVWGSAYAVEAGAVDEATAPKVARALLRGFREHTVVLSGCVSEVLQHDPANPNGWQHSAVPFGVYQNGGFWGTGSGWYIAALNTIDPAAARAMGAEYVRFLRANVVSNGTTTAWEWFNPNTNTYQHSSYVATVALAYGTLTRAGLLGTLVRP
jgi:hypothetical protein